MLQLVTFDVKKRQLELVFKSGNFCLLQTGHFAETKVIHICTHYKSSPIYISCDGGKKTKLYPEHEVAQFEIQKDCEASNEHLRIEKVLTAKLDTKVWKDKSISIISFPIEDIGPEKFNLKNPASKEVVKELLDLRIEEEKWSNGHYNTRVIVGSGRGTLVVGLVLCILGKLLWKKCRANERLSESV